MSTEAQKARSRLLPLDRATVFCAPPRHDNKMALRPVAKVEVDANNSLGAADGSVSPTPPLARLAPQTTPPVHPNRSLSTGGVGALQGPGVATSPGDAKPHDGPRPPWTGGYQSFTPSTPGFPGYEAENRVLPPEVAMAGLRPADPGSIAYNAEERTFDCDASLTDTQVGAPRPAPSAPPAPPSTPPHLTTPALRPLPHATYWSAKW